MDKTFGKKNYENIIKKHQTNNKKISTCNKRIITTEFKKYLNDNCEIKCLNDCSFEIINQYE